MSHKVELSYEGDESWNSTDVLASYEGDVTWDSMCLRVMMETYHGTRCVSVSYEGDAS